MVQDLIKKDNSKRRVLFLTPFYDNTCGVGTAAKSLSDTLKERGNNVDILVHSPWNLSSPYKFISKEGEEFDFSDSESVLKFLKENNLQYDVLHSHNQVFSNGINENLMKYFKDTPLLTQIHMGVPYANEILSDSSPHGQMETLRQARMIARSDKVIHLSEELEEMMKSYYGVEHPQNSGVIYNFAQAPKIDQKKVSFLKKKLAPNGEKLFLYAGRLSEEKGILELIQGFKGAIKDNPDKKIKLVICGGSSPNEEYTKKLNLAIKDLRDKVDFIYEGKVSQEDLQNYYAACDFFIQPSQFEHFSISLIEAMAHKKPIIMTKIPSMKKVMKLDEGEYSRYAIPIEKINSSQDISKAISFAINIPKTSLESMVQRANNFYESELTPEKIASQYEREYDSLINSKKNIKPFSHSYVIPISTKDKNLSMTIGSILEKENDSQIIISTYNGFSLNPDFFENYAELIKQGKIKVLESDSRITKYKSNALNKALIECTKSGVDYLTIILPGDRLKEVHKKKISQSPNSDLIYTEGEEGKLEEILKSRNPINQSQTTFRHSSLNKIGGFYDMLDYAEDMDLYQKMLNSGMSLSRYTQK